MNNELNLKIFDKFPVLESERLIFRKFSKKDSEQLYLIRSNDHVMKYMDANAVKNIRDATTLISSFSWEFKSKKGITWAIVEKDCNKLIGTFAYWRLIKPHCRAEIGYSLSPDYWGKGLMNEAFETLIEFGFKRLQLHSIEANVNPQNQKSIKLLERIGFKKEAYFRENFLFNNTFLDSVIYSLLETDNISYL